MQIFKFCIHHCSSFLEFLFRITFLQYDPCVSNACICCCCRNLKFIWAGNTAWIVQDNKSISFVNPKIDTCVFWRSSRHCFWTFETFFSLVETGSWLMNLQSPLRTLFSVYVSTLISLNSVQTLVVKEGRLLCLWPLTFLRFYDLSATYRPSKL